MYSSAAVAELRYNDLHILTIKRRGKKTPSMALLLPDWVTYSVRNSNTDCAACEGYESPEGSSTNIILATRIQTPPETKQQQQGHGHTRALKSCQVRKVRSIAQQLVSSATASPPPLHTTGNGFWCRGWRWWRLFGTSGGWRGSAK